MTTSADLLALAASTLIAAGTDAGARVFTPGDWPTWDQQYPALKLRVYRETKTSNGRGEISFTVITTIRILGQVTAPASADDGGAAAAEGALWALQRQVEMALINSYPLTSLLQQFPVIDAQLAFSAEGEQHIAGIQIDIGMEFYQGPEDFAPITAAQIDEVTLDAANYRPAGLDIVLP